MIDLSYLTEEEQEMIMTVLKRDAALKQAEEDRIKKLQKNEEDNNKLKYMSGEWFYEAKSQRHRDKIHGADIIRASMRKKKPVTLFELSQSRGERPSWSNSVNKDLFIPPELTGLVEEPEEEECEESIIASEINATQQERLRQAAPSPVKQRQNPFNDSSVRADALNEGRDSRLTNGKVASHETSNGDQLSSPRDTESSIDLPTTENFRLSQGIGAQAPVPKKRTIVYEPQDSELGNESSSQRQQNRSDLNSSTGLPKGILKRNSSSSSNDSEINRFNSGGSQEPQRNRSIMSPSVIPETVAEKTLPSEQNAEGFSQNSIDRKQVRFSPGVSQRDASRAAQLVDGKEMGEHDLLDSEFARTANAKTVDGPEGNGLLQSKAFSTSHAPETLEVHLSTTDKPQQLEETTLPASFTAKEQSPPLPESMWQAPSGNRFTDNYRAVDTSENLRKREMTEMARAEINPPQITVDQHEYHAESPPVSSLQPVSAVKGKPVNDRVQIHERPKPPKPETQSLNLTREASESISKVLEWFSRSTEKLRSSVDEREYEPNLAEPELDLDPRFEAISSERRGEVNTNFSQHRPGSLQSNALNSSTVPRTFEGDVEEDYKRRSPVVEEDIIPETKKREASSLFDMVQSIVDTNMAGQLREEPSSCKTLERNVEEQSSFQVKTTTEDYTRSTPVVEEHIIPEVKKRDAQSLYNMVQSLTNIEMADQPWEIQSSGETLERNMEDQSSLKMKASKEDYTRKTPVVEEHVIPEVKTNNASSLYNMIQSMVDIERPNQPTEEPSMDEGVQYEAFSFEECDVEEESEPGGTYDRVKDAEESSTPSLQWRTSFAIPASSEDQTEIVHASKFYCDNSDIDDESTITPVEEGKNSISLENKPLTEVDCIENSTITPKSIHLGGEVYTVQSSDEDKSKDNYDLVYLSKYTAHIKQSSPVPLVQSVSSKEDSQTGKIRNLKSFWEKEKSEPKIIVVKQKEAKETDESGSKQIQCPGVSSAQSGKRFTTSELDLRMKDSEPDHGFDRYRASSVSNQKPLFTVQTMKDRMQGEHKDHTTSPSQFRNLKDFWSKGPKDLGRPTLITMASSDTDNTSGDLKSKSPASHGPKIQETVDLLRQQQMSPTEEKKILNPRFYPKVLPTEAAEIRVKSFRGEQCQIPRDLSEPKKEQVVEYGEKSTHPPSIDHDALGSLSEVSEKKKSDVASMQSTELSLGDEGMSYKEEPCSRRISERSDDAYHPKEWKERAQDESSVYLPEELEPKLNVVPSFLRSSTPVKSEDCPSQARAGVLQSFKHRESEDDEGSSRGTASDYARSYTGFDEENNPVMMALRRISPKPMSSSKSLEDITSASSNERSLNNARGELVLSAEDDQHSKVQQIPKEIVSGFSTVPSHPVSLSLDSKKMKELSMSVPAFLQQESDGTDSTSESSFHIGRHKKTASSLTNLSNSSGMASMSSVSSSVMSIYSGDFGNVDVKGNIQFTIDYVSQLKEFHIFVVQCKDLAEADVKKHHSHPYVKSYLLPDKAKMGKRKTAVKKKTLNPTYNEILRYKIDKETLMTQTLNLSVWHNDTFGRNSFLGEVDVDLSTWDWDNKQMNWFPLKPRAPSGSQNLEHRGEMRIALRFVPQVSQSKKKPNTGEVHIWVKDCKGLPALRASGLDPFVKCSVLPDTSRKSRQKTRILKKTSNPLFNHTMVYDGFRPEDLKEACVELTVWDHDRLVNHFLGGLRLGLGTGKSYGTAVDWMDSIADEAMLWERMMDFPNEWVEDVLPLRMLMMAK
ncbi:synaptotagmin-like protein 2 isoform X2 [Acipenser ruthenus]|uniref:synaptotagmin-like protein 2 isoform X2 n=1 Tax=Acipenser ruthenus TaxID=7906 RepID=UPI00274043DE|nr:synaptotagmin-like protein 2 isoform X2 [Acipenser ruthenus]